MIAICLALLLVSLLIGWPLQWLLIRLAPRWGLMDEPALHGVHPGGAHKKHRVAVAYTGGFAITGALLLPILVGLALIWLIPPASWQGALAPVAEHIPGLRGKTGAVLAVVAALLILHVLGAIDDQRGLGPRLKLGVELAVAAVLAVALDLRILQALDTFGPGGYLASVLVTVLWLGVITNAMNMLDNMDGLSAGVGAILASIFLAATLIGGQWFVAALAALLLGSLLAFLCFNFPPARVFMGDKGSLVVGMTLAILSVRTTYFDSEQAAPLGWYSVLMPIVIMAIPLYDFVSVTLIRMAQGRSPFQGDHQHFSHRLTRMGLSKRAAVLVIWMCTVATGLGGAMLASLQPWQAWLVAGQCTAVITLLAMLERGSSR